MQTSAGAPAKAGPMPGHGELAETYDVGSSAKNLANALGIPKEITLELYSDSTLAMRDGSKRGNAVHLLTTMHPHYYVNSRSIVGGATLRGILAKLPTDPEVIAKDDVAIAVCMFNEVAGDRITKFSETSSIGLDVINLCEHLLNLRRPLLMFGGASDL